jgi:formylglycine-generating enzyme required for sulfatase activity
MSLVAGGVVDMRLAHERRECGCYADPGSGPGRRAYFEIGNPFHETIRHDYAANVASFLMDECLVTNRQFAAFLKATAYRPAEPRNFVKHWRGGSCPAHLLDHPIVYVDLDDARAYARWAGKRLPTEPEWQLAAQGTDGRAWPWGDGPDPNRCNGQGGGTTPVRAFPTGRSPYGCYDMAGNVWQWTESERSDGHTRYCIIRGGCFFDAPGSIWYVHGGAQPLTSHTKFLLMHPGLDRCSTIGFRCAADLSRPGTPR